GAIGEKQVLSYQGGGRRRSDIVMQLSHRFVEKFYAGYTALDRVRLFGQVRTLFTDWIDKGYLKCIDVPEDVVVESPNLKDEACNRINDAIVRKAVENEKASVSVLLDDFLPTGSTSSVNFRISSKKKIAYETGPAKSHVNYAICDSGWEDILCKVLAARLAHCMLNG
ncbi:MAG: hypothetical protein IKH46_13575, partial [Lachnospiraceae bacterium]|nr:hypothetical protein [Lachnospiraceae bacterium]